MARKKKHREEETENVDRWLVSYADFITLLFAFFVTMYAISRVDERKLGSVVESLQRALGSNTLYAGEPAQTRSLASRQSADQRGPRPVSAEKEQEAQKEGKEDFEKLAAEIKKKMEEGIKNNGGQGKPA